MFSKLCDHHLGTAASLEEKKNELAKLKEDITKEKTKVEMILDGLTDVSERFAGLDGKLGNFEAIWTKVSQNRLVPPQDMFTYSSFAFIAYSRCKGARCLLEQSCRRAAR